MRSRSWLSSFTLAAVLPAMFVGCTQPVPTAMSDADGGCPGGMVCTAGNVCGAPPDLASCDANPVGCGGCLSDKDCGGATPRCDTTANHCVPCLLQNDNCPIGSHCAVANGSYACSSSCRNELDCPRTDAGVLPTCCAGTCADTSGDSSNCGGCGKACAPLANAVAGCAAGVCGVGSCSAGFANCDNLAANGCEVNTTTDANNCGLCAKACGAGANGSVLCQASSCVIACNPNYADCDHSTANGCEVNTAVDTGNCGGCGLACGNPPNAQGVSCAKGVCSLGCASGFADCDTMFLDGCEVAIATDVNNCGLCSKLCPTPPNGSANCQAGICGVTNCMMGFGDCNMLPADGCESNLATDVANCGGCGKPCAAVTNGVVGCTAGACGIASCQSGYADCDKMVLNGCEANLSTDANHCGGCATVCPAVINGTPTCANAMCGVGTCKFGFADCNMIAADGCESPLAVDVNNCGGCSIVCMVPAHAAAACGAGQCGLGMCSALWGNCDNNPRNGCETSLAADIANCGACNNRCPQVANATAGCLNGACGIGSCAAGYADCDMMVANGCESHLSADPMNCSGCGLVCPMGVNSVAICTNSQCGLTCAAGFADCNMMGADGCEASLTTVTNCGSCGHACVAPANATAACAAGGACAIGMCNTGYADCDRMVADGCEKNVVADVNNCGACGTVCALANATAACVASQCAIQSCAMGYADCDTNAANGCEARLAVDVNNCGVCHTACGAGMGCSAGRCVACAENAGGTCATATDLGTIPVGTTITNINSLLPGHEAWYKVTFTGNTSGAFHPHILFTSNPGNGFKIDLLDGCGGAYLPCFEGGGAQTKLDWEVGLNPASMGVPGDANFMPVPLPGNAGVVFIHITTGAASCAPFTLVVKNVPEACDPRLTDCDGITGCETSLLDSPANCGACNTACSMTNVATGYCKAAVCNPVCAAGFLDCNAGMANDGCEANPQTDVANCGGCGRSCAAVHLAACVAGACSGACNAGFGDCNSNKLADGCEINLNTDVMHCGACPTTCSTNNLTPTCIGGVCGGTCTVGHVNCNNDLSDGCESDPLVDVKNCGGCGNMCSSANVQVAHCAGGLCDSTCLTNFADCNMNKLTDGCEVNIATDPLNCGACAKVCSANHVAAPVCANSVCTSTCSAGFADCNMNIQTDGCECDLSTRVCTAGNRCLLKMGQPCGADPTVCASGVCMAGACT